MPEFASEILWLLPNISVQQLITSPMHRLLAPPDMQPFDAGASDSLGVALSYINELPLALLADPQDKNARRTLKGHKIVPIWNPTSVVI